MEREKVTERKRVAEENGGGLMDWRGVGWVVPLAANCSRQANGKQEMSECRACINIAFKNLKAGREQGLPRLQLQD